MNAEIHNLRLAWSWAVEQGSVERLGQMAGSLGMYCWEHSLHREGEPAFRAAAERVSAVVARPSPPAPDRLRTLARLLAWQGNWNSNLGCLDAADRLFERSESLLERLEVAGQDTRAERALLLGFRVDSIGDRDNRASRQLSEQRLALCRELGDRWGLCDALANLGLGAFFASNYREARQWFEETLAVGRSLGIASGVSNGLGSLSAVAAMQGDGETAVRLASELHGPYQGGDQRPRDLTACWTWGCVLPCLGEYAEAEAMWAQVAAIWVAQGSGQIYRPLIWQIEANLHLGRYEEVRALAQKELALTREQLAPAYAAVTLAILGRLELAAGSYPEAQRLLEQSIATYRQCGIFRDGLGLALGDMGYLAHALGQPEHAWACLYEALQIGQETGALAPLLQALPAVALLMASHGKRERSLELFALAWQQPRASNSRWFQDVYCKPMAAIAAGLPPEIIAAAQERGRARDLQATVQELLAELEREQATQSLSEGQERHTDT